MAVKLPPPKVIDVKAVAFRLVSEPLDITMPGTLALPSVRFTLRPDPKLSDAFPYIVNFCDGDAEYATFRPFEVKHAPAKLVAIIPVAFKVESDPLAITMPGLAWFPSTIDILLLEPKFSKAFPFNVN